MKTKLPVFLALFLMYPLRLAAAFDLWKDIQEQTRWTLGESVAAGTSVALRSVDKDDIHISGGQYVGSALAQVSNYRFLSLWAGGTFIPTSDGTLKAIDTGKIGLNLASVFAGFVDQPPAIVRSLVIGPSIAMNLFSSPRVAIPFIDINFKFGS